MFFLKIETSPSLASLASSMRFNSACIFSLSLRSWTYRVQCYYIQYAFRVQGIKPRSLAFAYRSVERQRGEQEVELQHEVGNQIGNVE